jgi:arsenite methyltransferase
MPKNMIEKANANKAKTNAENVEFVEGAITSIPLPDNIADCIISNCVINLVPAAEKQLAFNEMYRLLKPGGRVAISDILARKELTKDLKENIALYVGCISGASQVSEYEAYLKKAGFGGESNLVTGAWPMTNLHAADLLIVDSKNDLNVYLTAAEDGTSCCGTAAENVSSCCSAEKQAACCKPDRKESCCQSGSSTCGCQDKTSKASETKKSVASMGIVDFNEWAGTNITSSPI